MYRSNNAIHATACLGPTLEKTALEISGPAGSAAMSEPMCPRHSSETAAKE